MIELTPKQRKIVKSVKDESLKYFLLYGGSRSGKSLLIFDLILALCFLYPGSKHLVARYSFANAKKTIWLQTMLPLLRKLEAKGQCKINGTQGITTFTNGSLIVLGGLKPDQIDAVLGTEYGTIWVNEANENLWSTIELLFSRLNDTATHVSNKNKRIHTRFFADLNPTSKQSWDYKFFIQKINPAENKTHTEHKSIFSAKLSPLDNKKNLHPNYIKTLGSMSEYKKLRFFYGEYGFYEGLIYNLPEEQREVPEKLVFDRYIGGLDFGHRHANVFSVNGYYDGIWATVEEHYKTGMGTPDIIEKGWELHRKYSFDYIYADAARSDIIEEMQKAGLPVLPAFKGEGSIFAGIMYMKGLIKEKRYYCDKLKAPMHCAEFDSYHWDEDVAEKHEKPVKIDDDCMDASRYGIYTYALEHGLLADTRTVLDFMKGI